MALPAEKPVSPARAAGPRTPPVPARTSARRLWTDRLARWVVTGGGLAIVASILGILVFILIEVLPLTRPARVAVKASIPVAHPIDALLVDEHQTHAATLGPDGVLRVVRLADGEVVVERPLRATGGESETAGGPPPTLARGRVAPGAQSIVAATSDGRVLGQPVEWRVEFDSAQRRVVRPELPPPVEIALDPERRPLGAFAAQIVGHERAAAAAQLADGSLVVVRRQTTENAFSGEVESSEERLSFAAAPRLTRLLLDAEQRNLFGGTENGELLWWRLDQGEGAPPHTAGAGSAAITAMTFLIGDRSLVVGQESGAVSVWFPVRQSDETFVLTRIRDFPSHRAAVTEIEPSRRNRTFLVQDASGELGLYYSTSERVLWRGSSPVPGVSAAILSPKGDGAFLASPAALAFLEIDNPHPEVSWRALFGRIWFEGYERPEFVWQSTGGTDDFEAKLSLTPLVAGTLKGTLYSLAIAIPLAILGAMFASQFLHPRLLDFIKPTVEIMASLPSVVLGFLAGLWLAPVLERTFPALILAFLLLPLLVWLSGLAWYRVPRRIRGRFPAGAEVFLYLATVAVGIAACVGLSPAFERLAFGGNFQSWLLATTGLPYDQRNAVVVGLAMGFAVIPIIFAISEDAFSNVPRNLVAGSLALGANRWQTVTRVVLPTASPGIFSAVMIGFGRAVGETMIVLMATGNTPIMELNAFNGFRTLSANIAVEIPEAPHGGTLYRTLFLAALLLFVLTFLVNTAAELVRQRLRRKYAQL
jgi:phosphate transport system permease protein